nr:MAG TPA: hypothetical protein [Caudoviricetes sp.]
MQVNQLRYIIYSYITLPFPLYLLYHIDVKLSSVFRKKLFLFLKMYVRFS